MTSVLIGHPGADGDTAANNRLWSPFISNPVGRWME